MHHRHFKPLNKLKKYSQCLLTPVKPSNFSKHILTLLRNNKKTIMMIRFLSMPKLVVTLRVIKVRLNFSRETTNLPIKNNNQGM